MRDLQIDGQVLLLLREIWNRVNAGDHWPSFQVVDRDLFRRHGLDASRLAERCPTELLHGGRKQGGADPHPDDQFILTVAGAAMLPESRSVLEALIDSVSKAVAFEVAESDGTSQPRLTASDVIPGASNGTAHAESDATWHAARILGLLLAREPWIDGISLYDGGWNAFINRTVRRFSQVHSIEAYLNVRAEAVTPQNGFDNPNMEVAVSPQVAIAELQKLLAVAAEPSVRHEGAAHDGWRAKVAAVMRASLGPTSPTTEAFSKVSYHLGIWTGAPGEAEQDALYFTKKVDSAAAYIESAIYELQLTLQPELPDSLGEAARPNTEAPIFIVHGHNHELKYRVARLLDRSTRCDVQILHEQANAGGTVIEKLERHASVAQFAVVLLTGDDVGRSVSTTGDGKARARQNVILELGIFIGALGRPRVAVLHEANVELPSDLAGLAYIAADASGAWQPELLRELSAAGIDVNFSRIP